MRIMPRTLWIVLALGCGTAPGAGDAAAPDDAGLVDVPSDAGASDDAGAIDDAGFEPDAGVLPAPTLLIDADFEDREVGEGCWGEDGFDESFSLSVRDDTHVFEGATACRLGVPEGRQGFGAFGGILNRRLGQLVKGDEIWIRIALYVPSDWQFNEGRSKFLRLRTFAADGGESRGYLDWYLASRDDSRPHHWIYEGTHRWSRWGTPETQVQRDTWETYEVYYYLDELPVDEGGMGRVRVWKNGALVGEATGQRTLVEATDVARGLNIFTWFGNEGAPRDQVLWIDSLQVAVEEPPARDAAGNPFLGG